MFSAVRGVMQVSISGVELGSLVEDKFLSEGIVGLWKAQSRISFSWYFNNGIIGFLVKYIVTVLSLVRTKKISLTRVRKC